MRHFREISQEDVREKAQNDFLTFVDESAEEQILEIIRKAYPDHGFLAEESGLSAPSREFQWIIDPLDGTKNYISGIPVFAVSIALSIRNEIRTGVVYDPVHQEVFYAEKNLGAYLNDRRIQVNQTVELERSLLATGFPFRYKSVLGLYMQCFEDIFRHSSGARRMGAAALDMAGVACGRFEGFWELGLKPWDMAAGSLLITEAGGTVTDFWNSGEFLDRSYLVATNGKIHGDLLKIIRKHFPEYKSLTQDG
jgi:myo-inositol-1(or 4)-monophosphatase